MLYINKCIYDLSCFVLHAARRKLFTFYTPKIGFQLLDCELIYSVSSAAECAVRQERATLLCEFFMKSTR